MFKNVYFPSYYPNGDYHFFIDKDWSFGMFGHPWKQEIVVWGKELIEMFDMLFCDIWTDYVLDRQALG